MRTATLGYFTVVDDDRTGWTGGLLVLDKAGRPIEFQCTLPVRPARTHEILFGPTLRAHLICDVIGKLLLEKCRSPLSLVCCDQPESVSLQTDRDCPIALVREAAEFDEGPISDDMISGSAGVEIAGSTFMVTIEHFENVRDLANEFLDLPDSVEPFERIREAIKEAQSQLARSQSDAA